jgi:hypothetical protein
MRTKIPFLEGFETGFLIIGGISNLLGFKEVTDEFGDGRWDLGTE